MYTDRQDITIKLPSSLKAGALGVSLVLSALLIAVALRGHRTSTGWAG